MKTGQGDQQRGKGGRIRARGIRQERSERTELQLLQAATWLFSERGFHGTGIRDIAVASNVAVSAMYYYASSKEELLEAIMHRVMDVLITSGGETIAAFDDPADRLAALIAAHVTFHARNPRAARVADHEFQALVGRARRDVLRRRDAYEDIWRATLDSGVRAGRFDDHDGLARLAILEMTTGVAHWYRPRGKLNIPELCERFATMGLALVGVHSSSDRQVSARLPDPKMLLARVELKMEPRRRPPGL